MEKQWTLVTGGAKRLGAELCMYLSKQNLPILLHYRQSKSEAQSVVDICRKQGVAAEMIQGDFSSKEGLEDFIQRCQERFSNVKNLINNVGNYLIKPTLETSLDEWLDLFQTNLHTPFALSQAFLPSLKSNHGAIINVGVSGLVGMHVDTHRTAYKMSKMGLLMLTKTLAKELAKDHVRVNMVSPGYIENAIDLPNDGKTLPMGRAAGMGDVARAVWFLLNEENSYITGQNIEVAGGVGL